MDSMRRGEHFKGPPVVAIPAQNRANEMGDFGGFGASAIIWPMLPKGGKLR